jgi:hypothetical protein
MVVVGPQVSCAESADNSNRQPGVTMRLLSSRPSSVVDPNPKKSEGFGRIRIKKKKIRLRIKILL